MPIFKERTGAEVGLQTITPTQAGYWLSHCNPKNRPINKSHVQRLAHDMKSGRWKVTNQGIAFGPNGQLLDGQHRLSAVVLSGVPIEAYVFNNIEAESQLVLDQGAKRSTQHAITLQGGLGVVSNFKMATLRMMVNGYQSRRAILSVQEERDLLVQHDDAVEFALSCMPKKSALTRGIVTSATSGVIARAWYSQDPDELSRFCDVLASSMASEKRDMTIISLRNYLLSSAGRGGAALLTERYAKTQRVLHAWLNGELMTKVYGINSKNLFLLPGEE
jgi:hypothetical protein